MTKIVKIRQINLPLFWIIDTMMVETVFLIDFICRNDFMLTSKPTLETLLNHRSVRKYTGEPISDEVLTAILEAGRAVSTSSFLQASSIIRVKDAAKRTALRQISCDMSDEA